MEGLAGGIALIIMFLIMPILELLAEVIFKKK